MAAPYADLELSLQQRHGDLYAVELRLSYGEETDVAPAPTDALPLVQFSQQSRRDLLALSDDSDAYGRRLRDLLFADSRLRGHLRELLATGLAAAEYIRLRLNLRTGPDGPCDLHDLSWETLWHPDEDRPLACGERECLSRSISSTRWRAPLLKARGQLAALAAVATPAFPAPKLDPIDPAAELDRARANLDQLGPATIGELGRSGGLTLAELLAGLQDSPDLLCLVAHGTRDSSLEPGYRLSLGSEGEAAVPVRQLLEAVSGLGQLPHLIVLLSCYSAGPNPSSADIAASSNAALDALGPRLVMAGVPAVIAAQGAFSIESAARFSQTLFAGLGRHGGCVDRAVAAARAALRAQGRHDWGAPVLYMRPRAGRLWRDGTSYPYVERLRHWLRASRGLSESKLTRVAEALLACPCAADIDWGQLDSLDELVESVRFYHQGTPELDRLDQVLALELPRPVSWARTAELREHLRGLRLSRDELRDLFQACRPRAWDMPTDHDEQVALTRAIYLLAEAPRQPPGLGHPEEWLPLVELVRELLRWVERSPTVAALMPELRAWAEAVGGQPLDRQPAAPATPKPRPRGRATLILELLPAVGRRQLRPSYMFEGEIDLRRPASIKVFPFAWLAREVPDATGVAHLTHEPLRIPIKDGRPFTTLAELRGLFAALIRSAAQRASGAELTIEFFLPIPLLLLDVECWEAFSFGGETSMLGHTYSFAVRSLERVYGGDTDLLQPPWEDKWEQYKRHIAALHERIRWFPDEQDDSPELVGDDLRDERYVALGLISPQHADRAGRVSDPPSPRRVLTRAIMAGAPAALVLREGGDPALLRPSLETDLRALDHKAPLPKEALKWRQQAVRNRNKYGYCAHLTLLWDNAERRPPLPPFEQTTAD